MKLYTLLPFCLLLTGCLSPKPSRTPDYFQLQPDDRIGTSEKEYNRPFLIVGPVDIRPYLDQPRIAVRKGEHEIEYLEYQRWAEPLSVNTGTVISANLRTYFGTAEISADAPKLLINKQISRLLILINRFDTDQNGRVTLSVQWALSEKDPAEIRIHEHTYTGKTEGEGVPEKVRAMNRLLTRLSLDMAKEIESGL